MTKINYRQLYAIKAKNESKIKQLCPTITNDSGIYVFTRIDDYGFKFAYIGQAVNLLERAASHLSGYQHIDLSIKKWGLYHPENNPYGWQLEVACTCSNKTESLDTLEQQFIKSYADSGWQLRNKTSGSQADGKKGIDDRPRKGYLQGKQDGKLKAYKDISVMIEKYTTGIKSKGGVIADRKTAELLELLKGAGE